MNKRYTRLYINSIEDSLEFLDEDARIVPLEAFIALNKLYNNDIKSFIETHIDAHICASLTSLCREYGPRVKCSIYMDNKHVELYSECFDIEILSAIVFGDLSNLFTFEVGYRDDKKFKRATIPKKFILQLASITSRWKRDRVESWFSTIPIKTFHSAIEYILENKDKTTELIFHIPCLNNEVIELLYRVSKLLTRSRIYILTTSPFSDFIERCQTNRKDIFISYLEALELLPEYNVIICNVDVMHIGLIVNRTYYIVSYEYNYRDSMDISMVRDKSYIQTAAQGFLRECLCLNNLIKDSHGYIYKAV